MVETAFRREAARQSMLYDRIIKQGTLSEPDGKPEPLFALPSTVNWMEALSLLVSDFAAAKAFYAAEGRRSMSPHVENTVFEQLLLGLHHLSALEEIADASRPADIGRLGVLGWYYGITNAASAMTAAQNGSFQDDHTATARMWDREIAARGLAMEPFGWRVSSLVEKIFKPEVNVYKAGSDGGLLTTPATATDARGAAAQYLSGTAKWYVWRVGEDLKESPEFKRLGVSNFRTKAAQELRDQRLRSRSVGFLHQASRYRGKANYREALFLAYGKSTDAMLTGFVENQAIVLRAFLAMAGAFASRKLGRKLWDEFVTDVDANRAFSLSASDVWS